MAFLNRIRNSFPRLQQAVEARRPDLRSGLHDIRQLDKYKPGRMTWTGYQACGVSCQFLQQEFPYLERTSVTISDDEFGYHNDHVYLRYEHLIIDPSWCQCLVNHYCVAEYQRYLFERCHPIFVGSHAELRCLLAELWRENKNGITVNKSRR